MIRNFITTIEIYPENIKKKIDLCILDALREKYNNKCFEGYFIKNIIEILRRGTLFSPRNIFNGIYLCDVNFSAECISYYEGNLMAITITDIDKESIMSQTSEYIVCLKIDPTVKLKVGNKIIVLIREVSYEVGTLVSISATLFKPVFKTQVIEIANINEDIIGYELCLSKLTSLQEKLKKNEFAMKICKFFQFQKKSKMIFDLCYLTEFKKSKFTDQNIYFIINPLDPVEEGIFRIAPSNTNATILNSDCPHIIRSEGCSINAIIMKIATSDCNYIESILELADFKNQKEFNENQIVWDFYIKNGNK